MSENNSDISSSSTTDPELIALGEYCPFIADVPISSFAEPFPIDNPDPRSDQELEKVKKHMRHVIKSKRFQPPIPLADFCLVAKEKWEDEESDSQDSMGVCTLL